MSAPVPLRADAADYYRDIQPQNIIRRDDGRVILVDFEAVQTAY